MAEDRDDSEDSPEIAGSVDTSPRAARFGEGPEGRPASRERAAARHHEPGVGERSGKFVRDVRAEMKRVTWPTATEVRNTTIITIVAVIFFALYLFAVDNALAFVIAQIQNLVNWLFGAA
jgi:preprotein translocase subunit SecE